MERTELQEAQGKQIASLNEENNKLRSENNELRLDNSNLKSELDNLKVIYENQKTIISTERLEKKFHKEAYEDLLEKVMDKI